MVGGFIGGRGDFEPCTARERIECSGGGVYSVNEGTFEWGY